MHGMNDKYLLAQGFSVPSGGGNYTLTSIEMLIGNDISSTNIGSLTVSVWSADASGDPDSSLYTLTNPASVAEDVAASFTAPAGATLEAGNTYSSWRITTGTFSGGPAWEGTNSDDEDATSITGWTIANNGLRRAPADTSWSGRTYAFTLRVNGTAVGGGTPSSDATLSALTVTAGGTNLVTFAADTETYTASVTNDAAEVTVTAMTTDSGASIDYLDGSDMTLDDADTAADGHQVTLAEGDNVIKVKVTAADSSTKTYTVTVDRAAADPQPVTTFVSNTGEMPDGTSSSRQAQSFRTGSNTGGYMLSKVAVSYISGGLTSEILVKVKGDNGSDEPGDLVADLDNPSSLVGNSINSFTAPASTETLAADTVYWVVVNDGRDSDRVFVGRTSSSDETATPADPNWSIGDKRLWRGNDTDPWSSSPKPMMIAIDGAAVGGAPTPSSDATLSGLTVTAGGTDLVTFVSDTETYTASVANDVAEVTVTATKNDSGASIDYLDGSDEATLDDADTSDDGHQVTLAEGDNVIKVKVTAADGSTKTYTVTVNRAAAASTCTLNTGDLWCGVVTVGTSGDGVGFVAAETETDTDVGALTDNNGDQTITIGSDSYTIPSLLVLSGARAGTLAITLDKSFPTDDVNTLEFDVGSKTFKVSEATAYPTGHGYFWADSDLTWSDGGPNVTLRLRRAATLSTDATLSDLTVTAGGTDLVTFASGTKTYTAMVASAVAEVTVTAETTDSGATVAYLDGDDATTTLDTGVDGATRRATTSSTR